MKEDRDAGRPQSAPGEQTTPGPLPEMPRPGSPRPPAPGGRAPTQYSPAPERPRPGVVAATPSQAVLPIWRVQRH